MDLLKPLRAYEDFKREKQYDAPVTIFLADCSIGFLKTATALTVITMIWFTVSSAYHGDSGTLQAAKNSSTPSNADLLVVDANSPAAREADTNDRAPSSRISIVGSQWMLEQNPEHFIVQYGSSPNLRLLKQFAAVMETDEPIAIYPFKTTSSGKPVYGIASSLHSNLEAGLNSVKQLPESVREFGPWVRPLKNVQQQIRKTSFSS